MSRCDIRRHRYFSLYKFLILVVLTFSGTFLIKYTHNPCKLENIEDGTNSARSQICRDELYDLVRLEPEEHSELNCSKILKGDPDAIKKALEINAAIKKDNLYLTEQMYLNLTTDCKHFREFRKYITIPMSKEEEDFPIAYSMVIHENIEAFERLLRAIYFPQNIYCIHVDEKSSAQFKEAVKAITSCFDNVFVASKLEQVIYASWSRVQADLNCMEDLLKSNIQWKYLLNTCGSDFPLKTNAEIVRVLKSLNGKNTMESERPSQLKQRRWKYHYEVSDHISQTNTEKMPPPIASPMFTGNAYIVVSRDFVRYIFEEPQVQKFIDWAKDTYSPDEHIWASLNRMPGVPGSSPYSEKYEQSDMNSMARMVKWSYQEGDITKGAAYPPCTGLHRRAVCIYGAGDLSWLIKQHHLFANKFDPKVDDTTMQCMEEYIRYKTLYRDHL
ncbi:PREDICTED: beta-1,3-galactosyl-O-glycosyl-glycoprotein beta-1,6-N-acetylglucosaminyltransferase 3 [Nanorana parkeri]|uniref:beta-1,3-galactosyl-O-glycosyl-glycoprotein beta-1,6-N-acetylglucosaminyltransferase 3 n=1 Tax=Nanorana parkeri TaxID=125878 RepID=UPI0008549391|nr:PREDICTED: beta-1,3-galactosyl-O-glycosyl-glycoprotein beta-1,6-N-acetylglucosaminyltransferase 3 [Nanorana parkeri]